MNYSKSFIFFIILLVAFSSNASELWVSVNGNDTNIGTKESPLGSLNMALRKTREMRRLKSPLVKNGMRIVLMDGTFYLDEPIFIRPEDSGTEESPTTIIAAANSKPILSGGVQVMNWKQAEAINGLAAGKVWVADAPKKAGALINYRQLWVNGNKAIRAKSTSGANMDRILSWDKNSETCWIPLNDSFVKFEPGMELFIQQWWAIANLRIKKMEVVGDKAKLYFEQPESRIQSEHPWPAPWISEKTGNSAFYLNNALSFLDEPGEWYLDRDQAKVYYYPREGEDMSSAEVMVPVLENLLEVKGTVDLPVEHIKIKDISFEFSNWVRPSTHGHVPLQAGMYLLDAYKLKEPGTPDKAGLENQAWIGRPRAAVEVNYAHNIRIEGCSFQHLSSTGLDLHKGTQHNTVIGNLFKDIGGSAINVGVFSDEAFETHLPYNPQDEREVCSYETITDNLITNVSHEDWGGVGISAGFVKNITIAHNEISDVSYTAIGLGWGWTKTENAMKGNRIAANKIHHYGKHLYDTAGIYTLSSQPESIIEENYIYDIYFNPYAHDPYHWFYLYTDEGSSFFQVKNNWVPAEKFLQNANGPDNVWNNNNAYVGEKIKDNAGIRSPYKYLLDDVVIDDSWPMQEIPHFAAVELVGKGFDVEKIKAIAEASGVIDAQVYQWKKHLVLYGKLNHIEYLKNELALEYPKAVVKTYDTPIYDFNRFERCGDSKLAAEWDHVVLTADLVEDAALQKEYLEYHKTQFEEWPEVAKGFCNADFQQLQIFKNGRQLLLVISIPKGASLDALNPLTIKDNPRVIEWNNLMKHFQTGIKGTKSRETWVLLNQLK